MDYEYNMITYEAYSSVVRNGTDYQQQFVKLTALYSFKRD